MYKNLFILISLIYTAFPISGCCAQGSQISIEKLCAKHEKLRNKIKNMPISGVVSKSLLNPEYDDFHNHLEPGFSFPDGSIRKHDKLSKILENKLLGSKNTIIISGDEKSPLSKILFNKTLKNKKIENKLNDYEVIYIDLTFRGDGQIYEIMKDFRILPDMIKYIPQRSGYKKITKNYLHSKCITPRALLGWLSEMDNGNK